MKLQDSKELQSLIRMCLKGDRRSQQKLFSICYPLAMNVCRRYVQDLDEAKSLVNEGMLKVFQQLDKYSPDLSFGGWLRRVMVNTAIDHYRKIRSYQDRFRDLEEQEYLSPCKDDILDRISAEELLQLVQQLPPAYRMVFSLYAVEEYTHKEIAGQLGISEGTSKSNYAKAKAKLQKALSSLNAVNDNTHGQSR